MRWSSRIPGMVAFFQRDRPSTSNSLRLMPRIAFEPAGRAVGWRLLLRRNLVVGLVRMEGLQLRPQRWSGGDFASLFLPWSV